MPTNDESLGAFAESRYARADDFDTHNRPVILEKLVAAARKGDRVLDLGCGSGSMGRELFRQHRPSFYLGLDLASRPLDLARKADLTVVQADLSKQLPLGSGWADLIYAVEIIEHLIDTDGFLQEMKRVLKPGGRIVLSTPNAASLGRRLMLAAGRNPHYESGLGPKDAGHVRYFVSGSLRELLARNGLKITALESDYLNFNNSHNLRSARLASLFPTLGTTLIAHCRSDNS